MAQRDGTSSPTVNSSFTWAVADDSTNTIAWLHNYWSDAYGMEAVSLRSSLIDRSGALAAAWEIHLATDATVAIDVREVCRLHNVPLPFEGQLLLELEGEKLVAGRPVQLFAEYLREDGEGTGVHGQYGLLSRPAAQILSSMRVESGDGTRTAVVLVNPFSSPRATTLRSEITVVASDGRTRKAKLPALAPRASERVYVDDVVPDLDAFLGGETGNMRVKVPCPMSRIATMVEYSDDRRVVNHGTIDRSYDQGAGIAAGWTASTPVTSAMVVCDQRRDTVLTFQNVWGPVPVTYRVHIVLRDADGSELASRDITVPRLHTQHVSLREMLTSAGVALPAMAHAELSLLPERGVDEMPTTFDALLGIFDDGRLAAEVVIGSDFYNADVPPDVTWPAVRRTRTFGRVRVGSGARTTIFLTHPRSDQTHDAVAEPTATLLDTSGTSRVQKTLHIPAGGFACFDIEELFPEAKALLGPTGFGTLRIRDTGAKLYGYYFVETPGAKTFPICHLIGG